MPEEEGRLLRGEAGALDTGRQGLPRVGRLGHEAILQGPLDAPTGLGGGLAVSLAEVLMDQGDGLADPGP